MDGMSREKSPLWRSECRAIIPEKKIDLPHARQINLLQTVNTEYSCLMSIHIAVFVYKTVCQIAEVHKHWIRYFIFYFKLFQGIQTIKIFLIIFFFISEFLFHIIFVANNTKIF